MKNTNNDNRMKSPLSYLIVILFVIACENVEQTSRTYEELQPSYAAPVTVLLDTAPPAKKVDLNTVLKPRVITIPKTVDKFYIMQNGNGQEKIKLRPPATIKAQLPLADFTNFTSDQGLVGTMVLYGFLDRKGQLWFSTSSGVSR